MVGEGRALELNRPTVSVGGIIPEPLQSPSKKPSKREMSVRFRANALT